VLDSGYLRLDVMADRIELICAMKMIRGDIVGRRDRIDMRDGDKSRRAMEI
jgi:hypothetical protein